jgi:hypothetical protein
LSYDNFLKHFNHCLKINFIDNKLHNNAYLLFVATIKPLFNPGCPKSCAMADIIKHAFSNSLTISDKPASIKKIVEFPTSIA